MIYALIVLGIMAVAWAVCFCYVHYQIRKAYEEYLEAGKEVGKWTSYLSEHQ